ncbi:MAG: AEC family transporter [Clostridiaceae bacterium]|jgi:predicted permease|nr:AEC family transporter [Clostridiaceae bacterium]
MAVLWETFQSLFPIYFYILLGAFLRKAKVLPKSLEAPLNQIVFVVFISTALFVSVYQTDLAQALDAKAMVFSLLAVLAQAGMGMTWALKTFKSRPQASVVGQTFYRSNFGLLGIVYGSLLFGAQHIGQASLLIAIIVPLYNIISVIIFEVMKGGRPTLKAILLNVAKNPIVLAVSTAMVFQLTGWQLPGMLLKPLDQIAHAATPLSLIVAGSALTFMGLKDNRRPIILASITRLLVVPLLFVPMAIFLGFRDITLVSLLVAFGGPVATPLPAMAYQAGGDGELAAQIVAVTSFLSIFSLHAFIVLLRTLGYW